MKVKIKKCPDGGNIQSSTLRVRVKNIPTEKFGKVAVPQANSGIEILEEGGVNPIGNNTYQFHGPSHDEGGIPIAYNGNPVEVEGDETATVGKDNSLTIFGNLKSPWGGKKFKNVAKDIAHDEVKVLKQSDKGTKLINDNDPYNKYGVFGFNTGRVLRDGSNMKQKALSKEKEDLSYIQNSMLEEANNKGVKPDKLWAKNGKKVNFDQSETSNSSDTDAYRQAAIKAAEESGIDPQVFQNLIEQESNYNPKAVSPKGARGLVQLMPQIAKKYNLNNKQLSSSDPNDINAVTGAGAKEFKEILDRNNGDYKLALAEYNGGPKAIEFVKNKLGKDNITGDEWLSFMQDRRDKNPTKNNNAWQNQTYDYINSIYGSPAERSSFNTNYYNTENIIPGNDPEYIPKLDIVQPKFNSISRPSALPTVNVPDSILPTTKGKKVPSWADRRKLSLLEIAPELAGLAQRPDYVPHQQFSPQLYTPYNVSFQDRLNQNQSTFKGIQRSLGKGPQTASELSVLAAQKYQADQGVLGEQFRTNQGIQNDVTNKNTQLLNQAELTNLQLADTQSQRMSQARSNTRMQRGQALASLADKIKGFKQDQERIRLYETMSPYRYNDRGEMVYVGPPANFNVGMNSGYQNPNNTYTTKRDAQGNIVYTTEKDSPYYKDLQEEEKARAARFSTNKWGGRLSN